MSSLELRRHMRMDFRSTDRSVAGPLATAADDKVGAGSGEMSHKVGAGSGKMSRNFGMMDHTSSMVADGPEYGPCYQSAQHVPHQ